ncbi:acyltransferase domain-containing protein [Nocardia sp. CDC153]|uniref:acyltransferase domain-containing protein n=1 Tax=Nocardia sp. CDC153 TaxID=3112167 RepID=UPI002DB6F910|nr:acyltransferase domain-containing protein [Nocardia sp. CDC153]MEC3958147.1 acyltransferase domain-containing protein [Nocardia sp. CDC153]
MSIVGVGCRATGLDFDHEWFGMDRLEAAGLTPRQRTNLEVAVEALDDSGLGCLARGSHAAVIFGAIGGTNSAHHLSKALDLRGPSLTVDSQRASPLVAVDMGVRLLADESVPFVLAGGVDLALLPDISDLRIPLPRGETPGASTGICTVLVLQRTADALRSRTRRYAEIGGPALGFPEAGSLDAHIALDDPDHANGNRALDRGDEPPILIPVTGRDPLTVHHLALRWAVAAGSYRSVREFAAATARLVPEPTRAAVLARDPAEAATQLRTLARRIAATTPAPGRLPTPPLVATDGVFDPKQAQPEGGLLLLFSGSGGHPRMGRALAARYPVFATALTRAVDAVVAADGPRVWTPRHGFNRSASAPRPGDPNDLNSCRRPRISGISGGDPGTGPATLGYDDGAGEFGGGEVVFEQSALFVFQVALAELLDSWGIRADAVAGHGVGEIAAAVACGTLSLDDGARVAVARARLVERAGPGGAAATLEATRAEVLRLVEPMRAEVAIAAVDGPTAITVSGEPRYIDALVRRAHRRAIFAQRIAADAIPIPPHLPRIRARSGELLSVLGDLAPEAPWRPLYSTARRGLVLRTSGNSDATTDLDTSSLIPRAAAANRCAPPNARLDGEYWADNASGTVELASALEAAASDGLSMVLEVGPHPVLTPRLRERAPFREGTQGVLTREDEAGSFLRTIARLYLDGRAVDWTALGAHTAAPPQRQWSRGEFGGETRWSGGGTTVYPPGDPMTPAFPAVEIRPDGAYVVAGGLGVQGEAAVRWLLAAGARDVVVLTGTPRPLPGSLAGMEDRIVLMRCDCADPTDLATALQDIRECGAPIRGIVHASGESRLVAAANLLELTAADPTDFTVLLTSALGSEGPGAVRELAAAQADRRVICVEWEVGPAA